MAHPTQTVIELEKRFWQSLVNQDADAALALLQEPALMVSQYDRIKFDHRRYREMAEKGSMVLSAFELSDIDVLFPNDTTAILTYRVRQTMSPRGASAGKSEEMNDSSTWIRTGDDWRCVMHTETPALPSSMSA